MKIEKNKKTRHFISISTSAAINKNEYNTSKLASQMFKMNEETWKKKFDESRTKRKHTSITDIMILRHKNTHTLKPPNYIVEAGQQPVSNQEYHR